MHLTDGEDELVKGEERRRLVLGNLCDELKELVGMIGEAGLMRLGMRLGCIALLVFRQTNDKR